MLRTLRFHHSAVQQKLILGVSNLAYQINQESCSCCHRCRVECPAEAIRFRGSKYWIDPEKCADCGHCVQVCHNDVISNPEKPLLAEPHDKLVKSCDILVIGGGASGMSAAARAATLGKRVLVLEKNKEIGGSAWYAHVLRLHWSKWHEAAGLNDTRDEIYKEFMKQAQGHVNGKLVRRILDADTDFINWLIDEHDIGTDFTFGPLPFGGYGLVCNYDWPYNHLRIDTTIGPGGTGWYLVNKLLDILVKNDGEVLYRTQAKQLIMDENGIVTKVLAEDLGGQLEINCKSCIVAAGAFSRNREMVQKFQPSFYGEPGDEDVHVFACATCTGDGIAMCEEIGADIDYVNARVGMFGPMRHPYGTASIAAAMNPFGVELDRDGTVYHPGEMSVVSALANVPGRMVWHVLDERSVERAQRESQGREPDVIGIDMDRLYRHWREELQKEIEWETMYKADTLQALAEQLQLSEEMLRAAVNEFNAREEKPCEIGPDGPFYALKKKMFHENSIGGIVIDENMNVVRGGRPVQGLFAVGDNTRGDMMPGTVGMMYIEGTISALTFALCSGYLAGEEAANNPSISKMES